MYIPLRRINTFNFLGQYDTLSCVLKILFFFGVAVFVVDMSYVYDQNCLYRSLSYRIGHVTSQ